jgi:O-antigen ligase
MVADQYGSVSAAPPEIVPAARSPRWDYLVLCLAIALPVFSFFPVTPKPDASSNALNASRITEFALLLGSAYVLTNIAVVRRYALNMRGHALTVCSLYIGWALCSTLWSRNPLYTFGKSAEFLLLIYIAALVIICYRRLPTPPRSGIEGLITAAALVTIALAFASNTILWDNPLHFHYNEGRVRLSFGYSHPLETGDFCAVVALVAFSSSLAAPTRLLVAGMSGTIVYLTDSRSTLIFLLVGLCIAAVMRTRSLNARLMSAGVAGLAIYAGAIFFIQGDLSFLPGDFVTLNTRTILWQGSLEIAYAHLLLGVGFFDTADYLVPLFQWAGNAHNAYLEVILATGLVGFFLLLVFLAYSVWLCIKSKNQALIGVLLFVSAESIFNPLLLSPRTPMLVLVLLMLGASECGPPRIAPGRSSTNVTRRSEPSGRASALDREGKVVSRRAGGEAQATAQSGTVPGPRRDIGKKALAVRY